MKILAVTPEIFPLIKTGGLADVAGALPGALGELGGEVKTLVPGYPAVMKATKSGNRIAQIDDLFGASANLVGARVKGLELIIIDAPHLYQREGGPYGDSAGNDWPDNWKRFGALGKVAAMIGAGLIKNYQPEIIHAHDWQAGLTPAYLAHGAPTKVKSVFTVHNMAFQGWFDHKVLATLGLPEKAFSVDGVEYYGGVGFLKAGLQYADWLTTVSPSYAGEIRLAEFGMGLEGLLNKRSGRLGGILNGIDINIWDPAIDPALARNYSSRSLKRRGENKRAVQQRFGLENSSGPLFAVVSRLTWQKGIDVFAAAIDDLVRLGGQLCVLGSGEKKFEQLLAATAGRHKGKVGFEIGYDEELAHLIQGGADAIVVPSRFEPCGLTQLIGLRYGAVPVVARTGGLADTVIDANSAAIEAGVATGIQFSPLSSLTLIEAIERTIKLFNKPKIWARMQRQGMKTDVSWQHSAKSYMRLYNRLLNEKNPV
ncbi:Glycogen synthase, ADP-glucose transglucosylase [hydrothermal vent metagenome]|uniref:starch synthase n=1 Tax=hydrothermal vent metagenome TaxID=652676 RepID=A0A3B0TJG6_9ZZZZ